jgi:CubicO group peptidase (beta-lactamase class C family)
MLVSGGLAAQAAAPPARMDQIVQYYVDNEQFSGSVLVARGDQVLFSKSYGSANREWKVPNSPTTKFRIGSITKQFTAACILLLAERGKLKLEDPIKKYYPDAPAAWDKVTLLELLHHTSGIHSYTDDPEFDKFTKLPATPAEIVKRVQAKPLDFDTGKEFRYSNTGYILLGIVVEKASGMSYADFLKANVLDPLGMKDSGYESNSALTPQRAAGYSRSPQGVVNANYIDMSIPYAAGAMYSTVEDLLRWQRGLFGRKLLTEASLAKMHQAGMSDYALGVTVHKKASHPVIDHGGGINGFNSQLAYYPEDQVTLVALSNLNGPGADAIVDKLGALTHGGEVVLPSERKSVDVPVAVLEKYVGTYELKPGFNLWFFVRDGQLISQATGQPEFPLVALSQTRFVPTAFEAALEFQLDDAGKVTGLMHEQNGRKTPAKRISDTPPAK